MHLLPGGGRSGWPWDVAVQQRQCSVQAWLPCSPAGRRTVLWLGERAFPRDPGQVRPCGPAPTHQRCDGIEGAERRF
jgi:hypothetical protein